MKKRDNFSLIILGVGALILAFLLFRKFTESFQDPNCPNGGYFANGKCYNIASFGTASCPAGSTPNKYGMCETTTATCESGYTSIGNGMCQKGNSYSSASTQTVNPVSCSTGELNNGFCLLPCPSGQTLDSSNPRTGPQCVYDPKSSSTSSAPSSAPSCTPSYKSIPGGSMELKCFSS